ncbi:hypothetical protein DFH07DRAFT_803703 [Mycena maculata]|uniref:Uncharacterized protein n=1 Tax=Mycena maculata TaxID=230809 RepID=A0AAD7JUI0_9AGAR|nr:hypothetical protein DFH07DRAFT_803703 [Mycena maculata]
MDQEVPRISIPSMRVWLRIKSQFAREIEAKIQKFAKERNLPEARKDEMLKAGEGFVEETFKICQHNIRINGRDFDSLQPHEQDAEPFDEALDRRVWSLADNRLKWHVKIASERRETPLVIEEKLQKLSSQYDVLETEPIATPTDSDEDMSDGPELDLDGQVFGEIQAVAGELGQSIPSQQERSERSRAVEAEYKGLRP